MQNFLGTHEVEFGQKQKDKDEFLHDDAVEIMDKKKGGRVHRVTLPFGKKKKKKSVLRDLRVHGRPVLTSSRSAKPYVNRFSMP